MTPLMALGENSNTAPFVFASVQDHGKSAIGACTRAVRERLPHGNTAKFFTTTASSTQSNPSLVQVTGRVSFQKEVGEFGDADFRCVVDKNKIVDLKITTPRGCK